MQEYQLIQRIRQFFNMEQQSGKKYRMYKFHQNSQELLENSDIGVNLDKYKEIVLLEETGMELGGVSKTSYSLVYPIKTLEQINSGKITLLGYEVNELKEFSIDFCIFILIGLREIVDKDIEKFTRLSFLSNGIEGFLIRSIPRRFWCRISSEIIDKNFTFKFLGTAIQQLYYCKFGSIIQSIEIFIINSYPDSIERFKTLSSDIRDQFRKKFKRKIDMWKKKIDCDYDWGCEICPYREQCYNVKELLIEREKLEK